MSDQSADRVRYVVYTWVPDDMLDEWNAWYNDEHIPAVLRSGYIRRARTYRVHNTTMPGDWQPQYATAYEVDSMEDMQRYLDGPAAALRKANDDRYGAVGKIARMILVEERRFDDDHA